MRTSSMRFTGLASGLDTESIVKAMIAPQQNKVDNAKQDKLLMELKKEVWKETNNKIYDFYKTTLNDIKFTSNYGKSDTTVSDSNIIKIDPNANMPEGNHTIKVDEIAKSASVKTGKIDKNKNAELIKDLGFEAGDVITITVNGKERTLTVREGKEAIPAEVGNGTEEDPQIPAQPAVPGTTIADVEKLLQSKRYEYVDKTDSKGNIIYIKNEDGTDSSKPEQVLVTEVDPNINVNFDEQLGAFMISTKNTGENESITFDVNNDGTQTSEKFKKLGIELNEMKDENGDVVKDDKGNAVYGVKGQDAEFEYNGIKVKQASNKINVNGLQGVLVAEGTTTVSVTKDIQTSVDFVKSFVEEYNKLIDEMNTLVDAPANNKYKPLTDEQKKDMSESDIKLWDEKVKASVLRNDSTLKDLTAEMRRTIGDSDLFKFGITTGKDWKEKGKLYIDEEKLKDMLTKDPSGFDAAFKKVGTKLYDGISTKLIKSTDSKSANFLFSDKMLDKQIKNTDKRIFTLEDRLLRQEDIHFKKFTAMEKMISQLNNQGSWFSSQLGGN